KIDWPWVDRDEVAARNQALSLELGRQITDPLAAFIARAQHDQPDEMEWTFITSAGGRLPVRMLVTAMRDDEGNLLGYCGIATDITEQRRVQQALQAAKDAAEAASRTKSLF